MKRLKDRGNNKFSSKIKGFNIKLEKVNNEWILSISFLFFSVKVNVSDLFNKKI